MSAADSETDIVPGALRPVLARMEALEARVAELESELGIDIPWMVLAAAVAAAVPNSAIVAVTPEGGSAAQRTWSMSGRLILMRSHNVR